MPAPAQTIWLRSGGTRFAEPCELCLEQDEHWPSAGAYAAARVEGELRADADVRFATCRRGHRIRVCRAAGPLTGAPGRYAA